MQTLLFVAYEFQCIVQQPGSLKSLIIWTYIYVLGCWYYNWTLFLWCPKVYKCNWAVKEMYIQQLNIYVSHFMRTYIYVVGCWDENSLVARETVRGRTYTSLVPAVQIQWVRVECIKKVYIGPWLLKKIRLARKWLKTFFGQLLNCKILSQIVFNNSNSIRIHRK